MSNNAAFSGNVPQHYDAGLGPVIFEPNSVELAKKVPMPRGARVLEIAAGTGRLTRHLLEHLPSDAHLTVSDLNPDMLAIAQEHISDARLTWKTADAQELPFEDGSFDVVVCQYGVMFYPDKLQGQREAKRVLKPGGSYVFSVWNSHAHNPWAQTIQDTVNELFPTDTPGFFLVPFSYTDEREITQTLEQAGFESVDIEEQDLPFVANNPHAFATGSIEGNPLGAAIRERGLASLDSVVDTLERNFTAKFGNPMRTTMSSLVVTAS